MSAGTNYWFDVIATNAAGSSWSTPQNATTVSPPAGPSYTLTAVSGTQINLSWNAVSGATGYQIDWVVNGQWQEITALPAGTTSYAVSNLTPGTSYTFNVGASNSAGFAWGTPAGTAVTTISPPTGPSYAETAPSGTQVNLSWNAVSAATSYQIDWFVNGQWREIAALPAGTTSYTVSGLTPGTSYTFDVGESNSAGFAWGTPAGTAVTTISPPAGPSYTATALSRTQVNLSWNAVSGATGYQIDWFVNGQWQEITALPAGTTSYTVSNLTPGMSYTFDVGASNSAGFAWGTPAGTAVTTLSAVRK